MHVAVENFTMLIGDSDGASVELSETVTDKYLWHLT